MGNSGEDVRDNTQLEGEPTTTLARVAKLLLSSRVVLATLGIVLGYVVFVVFFGLGAIVFAWLTMGIDDAQRLAAILLGIIATVVGFYFGQRGSTRAQMQAAYAMQGWQASEARARQLEDWVQWRR